MSGTPCPSIPQTVRGLAKNACQRYQKSTYFKKKWRNLGCSPFSAEKVRPLARTFQVPVCKCILSKISRAEGTDQASVPQWPFQRWSVERCRAIGACLATVWHMSSHYMVVCLLHKGRCLVPPHNVFLDSRLHMTWRNQSSLILSMSNLAV